MKGFNFTAEQTISDDEWHEILDLHIEQLEDAPEYVLPENPWDAVRVTFPYYTGIDALYKPPRADKELTEKYPTLKDLLTAAMEDKVEYPPDFKFNPEALEFDVDFLIKEVEAKQIETEKAMEEIRAELEALARVPPPDEGPDYMEESKEALKALDDFLDSRPDLRAALAANETEC
jgi:hypothetical protein